MFSLRSSGARRQIDRKPNEATSRASPSSPFLRSATPGFDANESVDVDSSFSRSAQRTRREDAPRSRLIFGARFSSPRQGDSSPSRVVLQRSRSIVQDSGSGIVDNSIASNIAPDDFAPPPLPFQHPNRPPIEQPTNFQRAKNKSFNNANNRLELVRGSEGTVSPNPGLSHEGRSMDAPRIPHDGSVGYDTPNPSQFMPPPYSRSVSVTSTTLARQDEDISSIMMRGATDLRNARFEAEEQRREISFLHSQLETLKEEKEEALKRLKAVKDAAKKGLQTSSDSLSGMERVLNELKIQSQTTFETIGQARNSLPDIQELRTIASGVMKNIEPLLDDKGQLIKVSETKILISDLELEREKAQQVADLLRDRLQTVGAELIDAKNRIAELEESQASDRQALLASTTSLTNTSQQYAELAEGMKKQQNQLFDVLSAAADAEMKLQASNEEIQRLMGLLEKKNAMLEELRDVRAENLVLNSLRDEQAARISSLEKIRVEVDTLRIKLHDGELTIRALEVSIAAKEERAAELDLRLSEQNAQSEGDSVQLQKLQENLKASQIREEVLKTEKESYVQDKHALQAKLDEVECRLERARHENEQRNEKLHEAVTRYQGLEERFEDQLVTLRAARESNGDLQERLISAEATYARNLEAAVAKLNCEITLLKEENSHLQSRVSSAESELHRHDDLAQATRREYEEKLRAKDDAHKTLAELQERRAARAESELDGTRARMQLVEDRFSAASAELQDVREQLARAKLPSPAHLEEMNALKFEIKSLQAEQLRVVERARTIDARYTNGDLTNEEKKFITGLIKTSQAVHEKELVAKGNELRRRDNVIKELRSKIHLLETTLAKHLQTQVRIMFTKWDFTNDSKQAKPKQAVPAVENKSMINPASWMSSDRSSSPPASAHQAPDSDPPSMIADTAVVTASVQPISAPHPDTLSTVQTSNASAPLRVNSMQSASVTPKQGSNSAMMTPPRPFNAAISGMTQQAPVKSVFGRLARDSSDEILDFEDARKSSIPLATTLGKRNKTTAQAKDVKAQSVSRVAKRQKTLSRKPEMCENGTAASDKATLIGHIPTTQDESRCQQNIRPQGAVYLDLDVSTGL
ncbi:uncharacterized protein LAESUDRAFT_808096 [Laetiporus sulphureus 93-53]|uniref:Uncharacterized protein n=1 Tax=Laetiporus sulphureus 93-53 TaxID=1314785 RepID=A0A165I270_9APHY|nr:uncharacterized protein LAESUDRAFT_808096 [Laetiporus sulphureus 93-53]KZT12495.1 hypothetical protein LAESUDRAFT_808096 [Laetiporus sulphureus 93-53]